MIAVLDKMSSILDLKAVQREGIASYNFHSEKE